MLACPVRTWTQEKWAGSGKVGSKKACPRAVCEPTVSVQDAEAPLAGKMGPTLAPWDLQLISNHATTDELLGPRLRYPKNPELAGEKITRKNEARI